MPDKQEDAESEPLRNLVAFWVLGFINNIGYVIMIAGAQEISSGGVGLVYFMDISPALLVKLTGPYWFPLISYQHRTYLGALWMLVSFLVVAYGSGSLWLQLLGVAFSGLQSGMMEASYLAMASLYKSRQCLTCWSSGTGLAGVGGYAWVACFHIWLGCSFAQTLMLASVFPVLYVLTFCLVLDSSRLPAERNCNYMPIPDAGVDAEAVAAIKTEQRSARHKRKTLEDLEDREQDRKLKPSHQMTIREKLRFTTTLAPYMVPLTVVYFAEYTMQTGVWSTIGFPVSSEAARSEFYNYAGLGYQSGVFLSRSSGVLFQANRAVLYLMPFLQTCLLAFFTVVSITHFWYNWSLLVFCFMTGLLGGGVYVNAFMLLSKEVPASHVEFALSAASVSDTVGIMMADFVGLILQGCLYSINRLPGATINMTC